MSTFDKLNFSKFYTGQNKLKSNHSSLACYQTFLPLHQALASATQHGRPSVVIDIDIVEQATLTAGQVVRVSTPTSSRAKPVGNGVRPSNSPGEILNFGIDNSDVHSSSTAAMGTAI